MFTFDLQRFDEETAAQDSTAQSAADTPQTDAEPIPEDLNGLPEEIARETMAEWEQVQAEKVADSTPSDTGRQQGAVPYDRFKEKVDEANQLKAQLAQYQQRYGQQQPQQPQQGQQVPQQGQQPPQQFQVPQVPLPQIKITPEISKKINLAIEAEAMALSGMTKDDVASLEYAELDDPRVSQWNQAKTFATSNVLNAIQQARAAQQFRAQQVVNAQVEARNTYISFANQMMAAPDFKEIQNFATNDFFLQQPEAIQHVVANSYFRVGNGMASPAEMMVVKNYVEQAAAAYRSKGRGAKKSSDSQRKQQATQMPRTDQIRGSATTIDGQLSPHDIEKMLEGDFTEIDPNKQKILLALS